MFGRGKLLSINCEATWIPKSKGRDEEEGVWDGGKQLE